MNIIKLNTLYIDEIDDNTPIYHYLSYCKLQKLLENKAIYFRNTQKFYDHKERKLPDSFFNKIPQESTKLIEKVHNENINYVFSYTTCWSVSDDNYAFWKIYTPNADGCMIATTIGKLKKALGNHNILIYVVEYVDEKSSINLIPIIDFGPNCMPSSIRGTEKFKIKPYEYEKEIRFVFYSKDKEDGYNFMINDFSFIEYFTISPFAKNEMVLCLENLIRNYLPEIEIKKSIIDESE